MYAYAFEERAPFAVLPWSHLLQLVNESKEHNTRGIIIYLFIFYWSMRLGGYKDGVLNSSLYEI